MKLTCILTIAVITYLLAYALFDTQAQDYKPVIYFNIEEQSTNGTETNIDTDLCFMRNIVVTNRAEFEAHWNSNRVYFVGKWHNVTAHSHLQGPEGPTVPCIKPIIFSSDNSTHTNWSRLEELF